MDGICTSTLLNSEMIVGGRLRLAGLRDDSDQIRNGLRLDADRPALYFVEITVAVIPRNYAAIGTTEM